MMIRHNPRSERELLKFAVVREFDGGLNVVDSDLNLDSNYAKVSDNIYRKPDGSMGIRWGTTLFWNGANAPNFYTSALRPWLTTVAASTVVEIDLPGHGLVSGNSITITASGTIDGIPSIEIYGDHVITWVDADTVSFTTTTPATAGGTWQLIIGAYAHSTEDGTNRGSADAEIINMHYHKNHIIAVDENGDILKISAAGVAQVIWSSAIAGNLSGAPSGWGGTNFVSFAEFNRKLIVCNGLDKPLLIDLDNVVTSSTGYVQYLNHSGSNVNTPVCRFVIAINNYVVMAGDITAPGKVYISKTATSGTWVGDGGTNDAVNIDADKFVSTGSGAVRSIKRFDDRLIIGFDSAVVFATLGNTNGTTHTVQISESIEAHGGIAHNAGVVTGDDLLLVDYAGMPSVARALFTGSFRAERASELIAPDIQAKLNALTLAAVEDRVHAVYNRIENQVLLFIPNDSSTPTETICYAYTIPIGTRKRGSWARFRGWNFRCSCLTQLDRVALAKDDRVFLYGNEVNPSYADYINSTVDLVDGTDAAVGEPIDFVWELPWADFDKRMLVKVIRYLQLDTVGTATFTLKLYVDNVRVDDNDVDAPAAEIEFVGGDPIDYGYGEGPYGGGRITSDERLWYIPTRCKIVKLIFSGAATAKLAVVAIGIAYMLGTLRR